MADFSVLPPLRARWMRRAFYLALPTVPAALNINRLLRREDIGSAVAGPTVITLLGAVIVSMVIVVAIGRTVEASGRRLGTGLVAIWFDAYGLDRYITSRRRPSSAPPLPAMPRTGALLATDNGIVMQRYSQPGGLVWRWDDIRLVECGPVMTPYGWTRPGLIVTVQSDEGVDTVPVCVNPSIFWLRAGRAAIEDFVADVQAMHRAYRTRTDGPPAQS